MATGTRSCRPPGSAGRSKESTSPAADRSGSAADAVVASGEPNDRKDGRTFLLRLSRERRSLRASHSVKLHARPVGCFRGPSPTRRSQPAGPGRSQSFCAGSRRAATEPPEDVSAAPSGPGPSMRADRPWEGRCRTPSWPKSCCTSRSRRVVRVPRVDARPDREALWRGRAVGVGATFAASPCGQGAPFAPPPRGGLRGPVSSSTDRQLHCRSGPMTMVLHIRSATLETPTAFARSRAITRGDSHFATTLVSLWKEGAGSCGAGSRGSRGRDTA